MIFESHAHYDDEAFDTDREEILAQCQREGIEYIVNVSASLKTVKSTLKLAERYPFMYAAVGVHPDEVGELERRISPGWRNSAGIQRLWRWARLAWIITGIRKIMICRRSGSGRRWSLRRRQAFP